METNTTNKRARAKERLKELKDFYSHLGVYLAVNIGLTILQISARINDGDTFLEAIWNFGTFAVWFFWGIGLVGHAAKVFSFNPLFGKDWEKRQIEKYMDEERAATENFKKIDDGRY